MEIGWTSVRDEVDINSAVVKMSGGLWKLDAIFHLKGSVAGRIDGHKGSKVEV